MPNNNNNVSDDKNNKINSNYSNIKVNVKRKLAEMFFSQLEPAERKILIEMNAKNLGIAEGLVAGALTLTFLRTSRSYLARRTLLQRATTQQQQMFTWSSLTRSPILQQQQQYQQQYTYKSFGHGRGGGVQGFSPTGFGRHNNNVISTVIGWLMDCLVAITTTVAVSAAYTDMDEIWPNVTEIPLVEGRSVVAREVCPHILRELQQDLIKEMQTRKMQQQPAFDLSRSSSDKYVDMNNYNDNPCIFSPHHIPVSPEWGAMIKFAENCKRRQVMERSLLRQRQREERGDIVVGSSSSFPDEEVEIPTPGVPRDLEVNLFSLDDDEEGASDAREE